MKYFRHIRRYLLPILRKKKPSVWLQSSAKPIPTKPLSLSSLEISCYLWILCYIIPSFSLHIFLNEIQSGIKQYFSVAHFFHILFVSHPYWHVELQFLIIYTTVWYHKLFIHFPFERLPFFFAITNKKCY